jgi:hypothetical protein
VWAGVYAEYEREPQAFKVVDAPRTAYGFRVKVLWVCLPSNGRSHSDRGKRRDPRPHLFRRGRSRQRDTVATLDPAAGMLGETGWREFPSYLYFPRAGCFRLEARSEESSWHGGLRTR